METFQECGVQMLREFRALLQQTPLPVNQTRLLQLLALNMFAVSNTQLKGKKTSTRKWSSIASRWTTAERELNKSLTDCRVLFYFSRAHPVNLDSTLVTPNALAKWTGIFPCRLVLFSCLTHELFLGRIEGRPAQFWTHVSRRFIFFTTWLHTHRM